MATIGPVRSATLLTLALVLVASRGPVESASQAATVELVTVLAQAGERVEAYFSRAQSLVCTETVSIRPVQQGLTGHAFGRTIESELRLWWEVGDDDGPATAAQTRRQVVKVNNRPPRTNDPNNCTVQEQQETETQPLSMLLPQQRLGYHFSPAGVGRVDGRSAVMVDFRELAPVSVEVHEIANNDECISYDVNGGFRGRLWLDSQTMEVLRLDQHLGGMVDVRMPRELMRRPGAVSGWTLERWDTSIRFGGVTFDDPAESLVLPLSSTTLQVTRGLGSSGMRRTETKYKNYKRFLTGGRIVG